MHRHSTLFAATVGVALFTVACDLGTSPTSPGSSVASRPSPARPVTSVSEATASTDVFSVPVTFTIDAQAKALIAACVGEAVTFSGDARVVAHQTTLSDGVIFLDHVNPQGAVAIGASTGTIYRVVGGDSGPFVLAPSQGLTGTFAANLRVIGPGDADSFLAHILNRITVTPTGEVTAFIDVLSIECR